MKTINEWRANAEWRRELWYMASRLITTELGSNDLDPDTRKEAVDHMEELIDMAIEREEGDLKCAEIAGEIKGMWKGAACLAGGYIVGSLIRNKLNK